MPHALLSSLLIGVLLVFAMMAGLWVVHLRIGNAGVVDIGWAAGLAILALIDATLGEGDLARRWMIAGMVVVWSVRLSLHLAKRILGHPEEGRYRELRQNWAPNVALKFLAFFEAQALLDVLLSAPILIVAMDPRHGISTLEWLGVALWVTALAGEAVADMQLARFKRNPAHPGRVCDVGLWRYSRHPNYFFEWLVWVAWALFAWNSPYGWIAAGCPALMLFLLYRVTGIPATEAQALRSKGEAYARYQRTTSAFVPWRKMSGE